jgi:membrane-bound lytic murein transglycosylase D
VVKPHLVSITHMRTNQYFVFVICSLLAVLPTKFTHSAPFLGSHPLVDTVIGGLQEEIQQHLSKAQHQPLLDSLHKQIRSQSLPPLTIADRLQHIQKQVPLTYNEHVDKLITQYSTDRYRSYFGRMLGLGSYYFAIYDQVFEATGLPKEIKYLSVVESALNPHAVSRMGATGPWQFMFATAKMYDLTIDTYMDERKDPISASYAAAAYLQDAYNEFGDWLLAIASYNCGKGNVNRAIQRSGLTTPTFWEIRSFLPKETQNYIPLFIAMTYMMEYHHELGIVPQKADFPELIEWVNVQQQVPLTSIASALNLDVELIKTLNPAYKKGVINGSETTPRRLILPSVSPIQFDTLYWVLNHPHPTSKSAVTYAQVNEEGLSKHRVKKGETLGKIALNYRVSVQDLKVWNKLSSNTIMPGQQLLVVNQRETTSASSTALASNQKIMTYVVKSGDTLSGIANKHAGNSVNSIKSLNGMKSNQLKPGMKLKVTKI